MPPSPLSKIRLDAPTTKSKNIMATTIDTTIHRLCQIPSRARRAVFNDGESATWTSRRGVTIKASPNGTIHPTVTAVLRWTKIDDIQVGQAMVSGAMAVVALIVDDTIKIVDCDKIIATSKGGRQEAEEIAGRLFWP